VDVTIDMHVQGLDAHHPWFVTYLTHSVKQEVNIGTLHAMFLKTFANSSAFKSHVLED
jgi:hypothetical protein